MLNDEMKLTKQQGEKSSEKKRSKENLDEFFLCLCQDKAWKLWRADTWVLIGFLQRLHLNW